MTKQEEVTPSGERGTVPDRLIVCTDGHRPAIADWAKDSMKECDVEYVRASVVRAALRDCLDAMEMQEGRERQEFHINQQVAWQIWSEAKATARAALALVDGPQETK